MLTTSNCPSIPIHPQNDPQHGQRIYYRTPGMTRKKRGAIVGGNREHGYTIQPARTSRVFRPSQIRVERNHIWTVDEHAAEHARNSMFTRTPTGGNTIAPEESRRRAEAGQRRAGINEADILRHPRFIGRMRSNLSYLAHTAGFNAEYTEIQGTLHNDDADANELYSEYITAAMGAFRTETSKAPACDLEEFKGYLAGEIDDSRIMASMLRSGKTAAIRHLQKYTQHATTTIPYDGTMEDSHEAGMRSITARIHHVPEHESAAAREAALVFGIEEQLNNLDDPVSSEIIKMKFGLGEFLHAYRERDIAARLRGMSPEYALTVDTVKERLSDALERLSRSRAMQDLCAFFYGNYEPAGITA